MTSREALLEREAGPSARLKRVSVIIPCRNERSFIVDCLDSVASSDYPRELLEVLVVDGMSEDGTREAVAVLAARFPFIKMIDNPRGITPAALNLGLAAAKGDVIIRMDAHASYAGDYVRKCVEALTATGADNVGGNMQTLPSSDSLIGRSIALAISHPFGVGNSRFRVNSSIPIEVDTVFGGCYRRDVFARVGLFNERLARGQDMEFNIRLRKSGGRIVLLPGIVSRYYCKSELSAFIKHSWGNGVWAILPFKYSDATPVRPRHVMPMLFAAALCGGALAALAFHRGWILLAALLAPYAVSNILASIQLAIRHRRLQLAFTMPIAFASLHLSYGFGSLWGAGRIAWERLVPANSPGAPA